MAREGIALDEGGAVLRNRHVPGDEAHLGHLAGSSHAHGLGFLPVRNGEADDIRAGDGVLGEGVASLVRADGEELAALQVNAGRHAAAVHVVHHLAVANADEAINDALGLVTQQGCNAAGVDGGRAQAGHFGMLDDNLLQDAHAVVLEASQEGLRAVRPIFGRVLVDAHAAGALQGLADEIGQRHHVCDLVSGGAVIDQQPFAGDPLLEQLVELGLIVKEVPVFLGVHPAYDAVGDAAGDDRAALGVVQLVHLGDLVIHIARVVLDGALEHIAQEPDAGLAAALLEEGGGLPHGLPVHLDKTLEEIRKTAHNETTFLCSHNSHARSSMMKPRHSIAKRESRGMISLWQGAGAEPLLRH